MLKRIAAFFSGAAVSSAPGSPAPRDRSALLDAPGRAWQAGEPDAAIMLLAAILREHHDYADAHLLLGTILHARGQYEDARDSYILADCYQPGWWPVHLQFGLLELDQGRSAEAIPPLLKALELGGQDARVHNALGAAYIHANRVPEAVSEFRAALVLKPDLVDAHSNLGYVLFRDLECFDEGAAHIEKARALAPDDQAVLCNWNMVLQHRGQVDEALALCDSMLARDPHLTEAQVSRALMLLTRGDFAAGWVGYEARKAVPRNYWPQDLPWPEWDGSDLTGKTIFVHPEQGLGDEIMFASCLPEFIPRAGCCIVECHPKLEALFRRSFPAARVVRKNAWRKTGLPAPHSPDWKIGIGSLPRLLRSRREDFPAQTGYLRAAPARVAHWRARLTALPGTLRVGISWRGGAPSTRRTLRSIALEEWGPVLTVPGVTFVSLQYSDCAEEIARARELFGVDIHHWNDALDDYDETAALVTAVDVVISVQTAVVHLAGALGQRVWALISAIPEWRYGDAGETMPWYPSVRLIRQATRGDWQGVLGRIRDDLIAEMRLTAA